jgi:hypothetical protein
MNDMTDKQTLLPRLASVGNNRKNYLWGIALLGSMFLAGSLMRSPESQAKGAYSTPVTVMNTNANSLPVLDAEKQARIPYQSSVTVSSCNPTNCLFFFAPPTAGYRLVAENLSGYFQLAGGVTIPPVGYVQDNSFKVSTAFTAPLGPVDAGGHVQAAFNQPTRFYLDPGSSQVAPFAVVSSTFTNGTNSMVLSGYLENCSITDCSAVVH